MKTYQVELKYESYTTITSASMNEHMELSEYIAAYIQEELSRGKTPADIDKWMIADAIEAFEGGAR